MASDPARPGLSSLVGRRISRSVVRLATVTRALWRGSVVAVSPAGGRRRDGLGALAERAIPPRRGGGQRTVAVASPPAADDLDRQAVARLAAIVEGADDAIISKTLEGVITSWNPAAERIFGWSAAEAVGQPITLIIPPERTDEERDILAHLRRGSRIEHFETERVTKDGRRIPVSLTVSPVRAASGEIVGASTIARDISERKRMEAERAALLLREQAARQEAESASRAKDEFLGMLSHELRNPLNGVVIAVEVLEVAGHDETIAAKARETIQRQVRLLAGLVEDLLDTARVTAGEIILSRLPLDLGAIVRRSIEALRESGRLDQRVVREAVESAWVEGDERRLEQVVAHLLGNAVKFTPAGGEIAVTVRADHAEVVLRVVDSGVGMSRDTRSRIFEAFVQSEQDLDRPRGGLGLGLTLVRRLVELHGGTVEASSEGAGRGAAFSVRLPRRVGAAEAGADSPTPKAGGVSLSQPEAGGNSLSQPAHGGVAAGSSADGNDPAPEQPSARRGVTDPPSPVGHDVPPTSP